MELLGPSPPPRSPAPESFAGAQSLQQLFEGDSPFPVGDGTIHVAVGRSQKKAKALLSWTLRRFACKEVVLLHVHRPSPMIPTPLGKLPSSQVREDLVSIYRREERDATKKVLLSFLTTCHRAQVEANIIMIENEHIGRGIIDVVVRHAIEKLVIGATPDNCFKVKGSSNIATYTAKNAPPYSEVWFVSKGKRAWSREASEDNLLLPPVLAPHEPVVQERLASASLHDMNNDLMRNPECFSPGTSVVAELGDDSGSVISITNSSTNCTNQTSLTSSPLTSRTSSSTSPVRINCKEELEIETLHERLKKVMAEIKRSKKQASAELVRRHELEKEVAEALIMVCILSKLRHPHIVNLIGVCSEALSAVYEYLPNGTLHDQLFHRTTNPPLSWKVRARIAAGIASALLFLHSCKPEKVIHSDLKPEKVVFDSEFNCKIVSFGACQFVPEDARYNPLHIRNMVPKGSHSYADPEYPRTGVLTTKSDIYSFGIIVLQLLTGRPPHALANEVRRSIAAGRLSSILDTTAGEWPVDVAKKLADFGLQCTEMNSRDRPELTPEAVRELQQLHLAEERPIPSFFLCPILQEIMHDPHVAADGFTYEGNALRGWLQSGRETSPMTNLQLEHLNLTPNHALRFAIQGWLFMSLTDQEIIKLGLEKTILNDILEDVLGSVLDEEDDAPIAKRPCHTRQLSGKVYIQEILSGHPVRCFRAFRVTPGQFNLLRDKLIQNGLKNGKHVDVQEHLGIFLYILAHGQKNRTIQEFYQRAWSTINFYFHAVLDVILQLKDEFISMLSSNVEVPSKINNKARFYLAFKDALGAIDSTHIPVVVPNATCLRYICRKG